MEPPLKVHVQRQHPAGHGLLVGGGVFVQRRVAPPRGDFPEDGEEPARVEFLTGEVSGALGSWRRLCFFGHRLGPQALHAHGEQAGHTAEQDQGGQAQ